jgi:hypothetical protein
VSGRANKVPQALRLDAELAAWLDSYSAERGVKKIVLVEAALRSFREVCEAGVPDLPEASAPAGRVRRASGVPSVPGRVVEPSPAGVVDDAGPAAVPASRAELFRRATQGGGV